MNLEEILIEMFLALEIEDYETFVRLRLKVLDRIKKKTYTASLLH